MVGKNRCFGLVPGIVRLPKCCSFWVDRRALREWPPTAVWEGSKNILFFPIDISLSSCACSGGERNSPSLISPSWRERSTECPWALRPTHGDENRRPSSPPRKRGSTSVRKEVDSRFRGNDAHWVIFERAWALRPFYLTAWVFLSEHLHCICAPAYPVTISLAMKSAKQTLKRQHRLE